MSHARGGVLSLQPLVRSIPGSPRIGWAPVDVRDVAAAHLAAMITPEAAGKRFCCATEHAWMRDIAGVLALFDKVVRMTLADLGHRQDVSSVRIRQVLGWKPRSLEEMVVAMGESMIEQRLV